MHSECGEEIQVCRSLQATGFQGLLGSKPSQLLHGRDFFILFRQYNSYYTLIFNFKMGLFLVFMGLWSLLTLPVFIRTVKFAAVQAVQPLDYLKK